MQIHLVQVKAQCFLITYISGCWLAQGVLTLTLTLTPWLAIGHNQSLAIFNLTHLQQLPLFVCVSRFHV